MSWMGMTLAAMLHLGGCAPDAAPRAAEAPVLRIEQAPPVEATPLPAPTPRPAPVPRLSCEAARSIYLDGFYQMGTPPDLTAGANGAVINRGRYLEPCAVPASMAVHVCAAVQNGRAVGVTVVTTPADNAVTACVAGAVRKLAFPSHPRLDITTTTFAGAR
jgi:hypothetical protein